MLLSFMLGTCVDCGGEDSRDEVVEVVAEEQLPEVKEKDSDKAFTGKPNKIVYWNRKREFNDMNDTHLAAAQQIGIKPLATRDGIPGASRPLYLICGNMGFWGPEPYIVDRLTHSSPYLVKDALDLLCEIGENFKDSLRNKHLPEYRMVVTSVLRTDACYARNP